MSARRYIYFRCMACDCWAAVEWTRTPRPGKLVIASVGGCVACGRRDSMRPLAPGPGNSIGATWPVPS